MQAAEPGRVTIEEVRTKRGRDDFLRLPALLYETDPNWVPNLLFLQRETISAKHNPFFEHGEAALFLAKRQGEVVGRISAQIDRRHNEFHGEATGFFGFFEAIADGEVSGALLAEAETWLRARNMERCRGPLSFSIDEEAGLLVDGFDQTPMIGMPYARPEYGPLIEAAGFGKAMDLLAYRWDLHDLPERIMEAMEKTKRVPGLSLRKINMRHLNDEVKILLDIYSQSWKDNWGYVPVSERAARKMASDMRLIADPNLVRIAEMDGEPAGVVVGIPNLYEAIRDFKGLLDPWKALKLLWRLKIKGVETGRVMLFGVKPKFRTRELYGLPFLLLHELYLGGMKRGYKWCEESWVLENNARLNALMPYWGAYVYKRYRIYEKLI